MKRTHKILAGLVIAASISGVAIAQGGSRGFGCDAPGSMGPMTGMAGGPMGRHAAMKFDPADRAERHLAMLKYQINVTDAQEPLWQAYEQKMKAGADQGRQAFLPQAGDEKLSAPERMAKMQSLLEERVTAMKGVHESFKRLYDSLTPEQKAKADRFAFSMGKRGNGGRQGGPGLMIPPQG